MLHFTTISWSICCVDECFFALFHHPVSAVDAYIHRTRARGIVKGTGTGCEMDYIEKKSDVSEGDKVISSGKDGFFPKGVVIGTVTSIGSKGSIGLDQAHRWVRSDRHGPLVISVDVLRGNGARERPKPAP